MSEQNPIRARAATEIRYFSDRLLEGADAAAVITEWDEFRALDLHRVKAALAKPVIVYLRNIYPVKTMKALGFHYVCVGRGLGGQG